MRSIFLIPLTALVAAAAGCGSEARETATRSIPERDLTLVPQTSDLQFASALETQRVPTLRTVRHTRWAARLASVVEPAPVLATPQPAAQPVAEPAKAEATPANDRELLPGKTVTMIPVSTGPSIGTDKTAGLPAERGRTVMVGGGGGTCGGRGRGRGRGPGIGMAPAPRPDFR